MHASILLAGRNELPDLGKVVVGEVLLVVLSETAHLRFRHAELDEVAFRRELELGGVRDLEVVPRRKMFLKWFKHTLENNVS